MVGGSIHMRSSCFHAGPGAHCLQQHTALVYTVLLGSTNYKAWNRAASDWVIDTAAGAQHSTTYLVEQWADQVLHSRPQRTCMLTLLHCCGPPAALPPVADPHWQQ
jgi:hypothetical protein